MRRRRRSRCRSRGIAASRFGQRGAEYGAALALEEAVTGGRVKRGDHVLLQGVGGGFTWGSVLVKY